MRTVLFVCEHGSAKSVVAAAHFNRLAKERGLPFHAVSRGTSPDPVNHPAAVNGLDGDNLRPQASPQLLSLADIEAAASIVAFCDLPPEYAVDASSQVWSVPPVSEDYAASRDAIVSRILRLLEDLTRPS
jgi:protein-tyrosine-phosphatase